MTMTPDSTDTGLPLISVVHGPNLNLLGTREPEIYGHTTLKKINQRLVDLGNQLGLEVESFQTNGEGRLVDHIQKQIGRCQGLIINPAAYTHTSVAIRDALLLLDVPTIEVHLSNIHKRESFRQKSLIAGAVTAQISGLGPDGYEMALRAISKMIG